MIKLAHFKPEEILPLTQESYPEIGKFVVDGTEYEVKMRSVRYNCFFNNPCCVCCGIKGTVMVLEYSVPHRIVPERFQSLQRPHFNLYAETPEGLLLMTRDHIIPQSFGGKDIIENVQTMCYRCNKLKSNKIMTIEELREKLKEPLPEKNKKKKEYWKARIARKCREKREQKEQMKVRCASGDTVNLMSS